MFGQNSGSGGGFGGGGGGFGGGGFGAGAGANPNATPWSPNTPFGGGGAPAPAQTPLAAAARPSAARRRLRRRRRGRDALRRRRRERRAAFGAAPGGDAFGRGGSPLGRVDGPQPLDRFRELREPTRREAAAALDGTDAFHKGKAIHCALQAARPAPDAGGKGAPGGKGGKGAASAGGARRRRRPLLRQGLTREAPPPKEAPKPKPAERADLKARTRSASPHDISKTPARPRSPRSRSPAKIVQQEAGAADDLVGACLQFCPQDEIDERVRFKELDKYEKPPGHEAMDDDELARRAIPFAMKKYKRSAAGDVQSVPEIVRPPDVLFAAFEHLAAHVIDDAAPGDSEDDQMTRYIFLWNRFRAIRKDFILQNYTTGGNVDARVPPSRACALLHRHRAAARPPEWREGIAHGKHNAESLSETLSAPRVLRDGQARADGDVLRNEPEFTQYWLIYFLDQEGRRGGPAADGARAEAALPASPTPAGAAEIKLPLSATTRASSGSCARRPPVRCLAVAQYADGMRLDALEVMGKAYASRSRIAGELADLLRRGDAEEARLRELVAKQEAAAAEAARQREAARLAAEQAAAEKAAAEKAAPRRPRVRALEEEARRRREEAEARRRAAEQAAAEEAARREAARLALIEERRRRTAEAGAEAAGGGAATR
ncbi:RNA binding-protein [Aureococcus anophagefferens]|nr:RNA binding-protein [Aureococcus anophagefferens]